MTSSVVKKYVFFDVIIAKSPYISDLNNCRNSSELRTHQWQDALVILRVLCDSGSRSLNDSCSILNWLRLLSLCICGLSTLCSALCWNITFIPCNHARGMGHCLRADVTDLLSYQQEISAELWVRCWSCVASGYLDLYLCWYDVLRCLTFKSTNTVPWNDGFGSSRGQTAWLTRFGWGLRANT